MTISNIQKLSDFTIGDVLRELPERYINNKDLAEKVYIRLVKSNLKYNVSSGYTTDRSGHLSNFTCKDDIPNYTNRYDVLSDQFMPWVNNGISRILNGFDK